MLISPISAWEIVMKHARRPEELGLSCPPDAFFEAFVKQPGIAIVELSVSVLVESTTLPDYPGRDPADPMVVATALRWGARIVTGDRQMLGYLDDGIRF